MNGFWTCARTHPNAEKIAMYNLQRQDFEYYQPKLLERRIKRHKQLNVEVPLFPCYLFVRVTEKWRSLQYTYGIASIISAGGIPSIVQDSVIDGLRKRELGGYVQLPSDRRFNTGDQVKIQSGAFAGQHALVQRMPARDRQKILLSLLANKINALVDKAELEAV